MNHYAIFLQSYNSFTNNALFHHNGKAGRQFLVPQLARAYRQVTADVFRTLPLGGDFYERFLDQYQTVESSREELKLDRQQCDLEYERQQKSDHYGNV